MLVQQYQDKGFVYSVTSQSQRSREVLNLPLTVNTPRIPFPPLGLQINLGEQEEQSSPSR
jgi:hypothetical protein